MKKIILVVGIILLVCQTGFTQKYKVKRKTGAILKDKKEIAKVEGKVSVFKESYMDIYQNDEVVLSLKEKHWKCPFKEMEGFPYYEFKFPSSGDSLNVKTNYTFANEKQIIKILMADNGLHLYEDGFKKEELDQLKASEVVTSVQNDTLQWNEILTAWQKELEENEIEVDKEVYEQIGFRKIEGNSSQYGFMPNNTITHLIYRKPEKPNGEKYPIIGAISYQNVTREQNFGRAVHDIQIFKKVKSTVDYMGNKSSFVPLAYCDLSSISSDEYVSYLDGATYQYLSFNHRMDDGDLQTRIQKILDDLAEKEML